MGYANDFGVGGDESFEFVQGNSCGVFTTGKAYDEHTFVRIDHFLHVFYTSLWTFGCAEKFAQQRDGQKVRITSGL